jgi:hypothetical protein
MADVIMILVMLLIVMGGISLICLARYSQRKHEELRAAGVREFDATRIMQAPTFAESFKLQFFGPQPRLFERAGQVLAFGVTVILVIALGILGVIIFGVVR